MKEKLECFVCPITHNKWGENRELPDDELEFITQIDPEVQTKLDKGLCLLMEIEEPKDLPETEEVVQISGNSARRTGRMAFVSDKVVVELFGQEHTGTKTALVSKDVMDMLEQLSNQPRPIEQIPGDVAESVAFEELPKDE